MLLKPLTRENIEQIIELEKKHAPGRPLYARYDKEALNFIFNNPKTCKAYGLYDGNKLIGWGAYRTQWNKDNSKEKGIYEISSIVVHTAHRRRGGGKMILNRIIQDIKSSQDYKNIYLTVSPLNIGALLLYLKNGFTIYNYKKDVYGKGAHRLYLRLET